MSDTKECLEVINNSIEKIRTMSFKEAEDEEVVWAGRSMSLLRGIKELIEKSDEIDMPDAILNYAWSMDTLSDYAEKDSLLWLYLSNLPGYFSEDMENRSHAYRQHLRTLDVCLDVAFAELGKILSKNQRKYPLKN